MHSQYTAEFLRDKNKFFMADKFLNNKNDNFRIKYLSYCKISAIVCVLYFLFLKGSLCFRDIKTWTERIKFRQFQPQI